MYLKGIFCSHKNFEWIVSRNEDALEYFKICLNCQKVINRFAVSSEYLRKFKERHLTWVKEVTLCGKNDFNAILLTLKKEQEDSSFKSALADKGLELKNVG